MAQDCAHCQKTGTCTNGKDGASCSFCVAKAAQPTFGGFGRPIPPVSTMGLPCGVCIGTAVAETASEKLVKVIAPLLALFIILIGFLIILSISLHTEHHSQVLTLIGTLIGGITGYYFGGKHTPIENEKEKRLPDTSTRPHS